MNPQQKLVLITVAVLAVSFVILSPGVVLNIPPHKNRFKSKNIFFTGETHITSALVHSIIFGVVAYFLLTKYTLAPQVASVAQSIASTVVAPVSAATGLAATSLAATGLAAN